MNFRTNDLRNHDDSGARGIHVDYTAQNRGRNAVHTLDVGGLLVASLRNLNRRYRGKVNVRLLAIDVCNRRGTGSSILDYERALCNALADLEMQGCIKVTGGLFKGDTPNLNARIALTRLMR